MSTTPTTSVRVTWVSPDRTEAIVKGPDGEDKKISLEKLGCVKPGEYVFVEGGCATRKDDERNPLLHGVNAKKAEATAVPAVNTSLLAIESLASLALAS